MLPRYQEVLGLPKAKVQEILAEETYYTANQALKAGLIDEIIDPADIDDEALEAASDEALTEDHWREIIQFSGKHPPESVQNYLCSKVPDAKAHFAALKQPAKAAKPLANHDPDEDDMTPEQIQKLTDSISGAVKTAVTEGIEAGMKATATAFGDEMKPLMDTQTDAINAGTTAAKASTETVIQNLKDQSEKTDQYQEKQAKSLDDVNAKLKGIKKLPVNNQHIDDHSGSNHGDSRDWKDPDNRPYS
jgi:enoyl-CoA hydratase/carnithine racemase